MIGSIITAFSGAVNRPADRDHEKEMLAMQHEADQKFAEQLERQNQLLYESNSELLDHVAGKNKETDDLFMQLMGDKENIGDANSRSTAAGATSTESGAAPPPPVTSSTDAKAAQDAAAGTTGPDEFSAVNKANKEADDSFVQLMDGKDKIGDAEMAADVVSFGPPAKTGATDSAEATAPAEKVTGPLGETSLPPLVADFINETKGIGDTEGTPATPANAPAKDVSELSDREKTSMVLDMLDKLNLPPAVAALIDALKALVDADKSKDSTPVEKAEESGPKDAGDTGETKGKAPEAAESVKETGKTEAPTLDPIADAEAALDAIIDVEKKGEKLTKDIDRQVEAGTITEAEGDKLKAQIEAGVEKVKTSFEEGSDTFGKDIATLDKELSTAGSNLKELGMLESKAEEVLNEVDTRVDKGQISNQAADVVRADVAEGLDVARKAATDLSTTTDVGKFTDGMKDEKILGEFGDYLDKTDGDLNKLAQLDKKFDKVDGATNEDGAPSFSEKQVRVELETLKWE